jgi:signal transduction histidine kinase
MAIGSIHAVVDIRPLIEERSAVTTALVVTNGGMTLVLAGVGYLGTRRLLRPLRVLTDHLTKGARGSAVAIPAATVDRAAPEVRRLFGAFNELVAASEQRELLAHKLAEEERLASLGRLASGMAHEINNPLGGLFNAVHTIRRHGDRADIRIAAVRLIERGLGGIRDMVEATLQTYRPDPTARPFSREDLENIRVLAGPEARRRQLEIVWRDGLDGEFPAPRTPVRQALLNLVLNACGASPPGSVVRVDAWVEGGRLVLVVEDSGPGLDDAYADILLGRDATLPIGGAGGLGLWMTRRVVADIRGSITLATPGGGGTRIRVEVPPDPAASPAVPPSGPPPRTGEPPR